MTLPGTDPRTAPTARPAADPAPVPAGVPAPATATAPTAGPEAGPEALIAERRRRIDALDARLIDLVRERMNVSAEVQAARVGSGGRRVHLAREMEILRAYGDALGRPGTALAMTLLELCRGKV
ncbi:chorismate mutase [Streptomyces sp. HPF1205]|uniref:chorismate mutase n=1 Tax=Streptomyces sp. HPF1205 TaxID=2873262 RepID=UPI001CED5491|nr:chorismate mutase [Streptomyces sp. HPF1205]